MLEKRRVKIMSREGLTEIRKKITKYQNCISTNIIRRTVGLKTDGTVVTVGINKYGQCNNRDWQNIVMISACTHTVGLKADGTVIAVGNNDYGQCNTSDWRDIVTISTSYYHTVCTSIVIT